jgi:peptide/nickel transport system substrate-binding protein
VVDNAFILDTTDPQRAFSPTGTIVDRAVFDTLFTYDKNDFRQPVPQLVQSWTAKQSRIFTFHLRQDVHFADDTPLTSGDVVFSLRRLVNLKGNPAHLLPDVTVSATGPYTVVIASKTPLPQLPAILTSASTGIVNAKLVEAHGGTDGPDASTADKSEAWFNSASSAGAGSGPYELESYSPTSQIVLSPNPRYWGARQPAFREIVIRNMTAAAQLLNIQHGAHQIATDVPSDQAQGLSGHAQLTVSRQPSPWVFYVFTNDDRKISPVTSNMLFQKAVREALDYAGLSTLAGPGAVVAPGLIPSMIPGALPAKEAPHRELDKAKEDLTASGVATDPVTLQFPSDLTISGVPVVAVAQKVQSDLEAAGFKVTLAGSPTTTFLPQFRAGHIAFGIWLYTFDYPDPADYQVFMPGNLVALHAGWHAGSDPAIARLAARAAAAQRTAARDSLYQQLQLALDAQSPFIPIVQPAEVVVATSDLSGVRLSDAYILDLTQVVPS